MEFARLLQYQLPLMRGDDIRAVQQALTTLNIKPPCGNADGVYGEQTSATVRAFQQGRNVGSASGTASLDVDGKVGPATWAALFDQAAIAGGSSPHIATASTAISADIASEIPLNKTQIARLKHWLIANFKPRIDAAINQTPIDFDLVCAIAAKESAIYWINFVDRIKPEEILPLCVFDATGDFPGTEGQRSAFPVNAAALRKDPRYGDALTEMLITEANKMRRTLRGFGAANYLYKGYGLFQYDLQNIVPDEAFFRQKLWYNFDDCMARLMSELKDKLKRENNDLTQAVRAYNGSGPRAEKYVKSVMIMREWSMAVA
jgi:hypothetical protein